MNQQLFLQEINKALFRCRMISRQRQGILYKLAAFDKFEVTDNRWMSYMLATSYHETGKTMQPIEEWGKGYGKPYGRKIKNSGLPYTWPDQIYYGRGDVQLTWFENYESMGNLMNLPLLEQPDLALESEISAQILVEGMILGRSNRGDFTGRSLEDYFNHHRDDPFGARRIVNGLDNAHTIAGYHYKFLEAIRKAL
jgi:hypothetical protein